VAQQSIITCYTLFELEHRGNRSTIRNWNTLVQTLSLKTQPIIINFPSKEIVDIKQTKFGSKYKYNNLAQVEVYTFNFTSENMKLYEIDDNPIGVLISDCNFVPMLDYKKIIIPPSCLITAGEYCNIYFALT
jgi:hypothetical protein